jgi:acyl dehydratase
MSTIENRTFDEIAIGQSASLSRLLTRRDIELFAVVSGDVNPSHVDPEFAKDDMFHKLVAHGMWSGALISTLLGTELPGPGTVYVSQSLHFHRPVGVGDMVTATITASAKNAAKHHVTFDCTVVNQENHVVVSGTADVIAPVKKVKRPRVPLPNVTLSPPRA